MFFSERSVSATPPPYLSRRSRQRERLSASELFSVRLFFRLSICLTVAKMQKNAIISKTKQFRATVSIDDL